MDTSAGFCFRNSLYTMYTTFIFQSGISTCTCDHKCYFLKSADSVLIENMMGLNAGPMRLPLCDMSPANAARLRAELVKAGLINE